MQVFINQKSFYLNDPVSLDQIPDLVQAKKPFAIAVNKVFIPKNDYQKTRVKENDSIEIISPITGG